MLKISQHYLRSITGSHETITINLLVVWVWLLLPALLRCAWTTFSRKSLDERQIGKDNYQRKEGKECIQVDPLVIGSIRADRWNHPTTHQKEEWHGHLVVLKTVMSHPKLFAKKKEKSLYAWCVWNGSEKIGDFFTAISHTSCIKGFLLQRFSRSMTRVVAFPATARVIGYGAIPDPTPMMSSTWSFSAHCSSRR
jgi:hypothetical protein